MLFSSICLLSSEETSKENSSSGTLVLQPIQLPLLTRKGKWDEHTAGKSEVHQIF